MANDDDFTFCQVGAPDNQDYVDAQKIAQDISEIRIKDEPSNNDGTSQSNGAPWEGKLGNITTSKKQGTVGSLSFTVIDTSPGKQASGTSGQVASKDGGFSVPTYQKQIKPARKPVARAKVPYEKGYSQMDWLKLTRTHPDLAGLKGQSNRRLISIDEVKEHQNAEAMWTVLKGHVYNITPYMKFHPGAYTFLFRCRHADEGRRKRLHGIVYSRIGYTQYTKSGSSSAIADGAPLPAILASGFMNKYHAWVNAEVLMEKCLVGILDDSK
ncbi:hypothetical protein MTR67_004176 [Solanum verrucosum]|uniref:Cytochrome b5 heme-binding domain-containing protein n=1 Tax=Solanum verrucosum TaxID=315347 RepID=A0AAF0TA00_SOLVR|nr:hypothetical protein MTR67_004176 [Solanum verrucosum]